MQENKKVINAFLHTVCTRKHAVLAAIALCLSLSLSLSQ